MNIEIAELTMADLKTARAIKARVRDQLGERDEVCGISIERCAEGYGVRVDVSRADPCVGVPTVVAGVPVRMRVTGSLPAISWRSPG